MISANQLKTTASFLSVDEASIKSVAEVESGGEGFVGDKPVILFEPHVFYRELKSRNALPKDYLLYEVVKDKKGKDTGIRKPYPNPKYADLMYPRWGTRPYAKGQAAQHALLDRAVQIHREAALCSASWGKFQIMGFNYKACGCDTVQEMVNAVFKSEDEHLRLFGNFIKTNGLDKYLRAHDWAGFALRYNGEGYKANKYDLKLATAYAKYK